MFHRRLLGQLSSLPLRNLSISPISLKAQTHLYTVHTCFPTVEEIRKSIEELESDMKGEKLMKGKN